MHDLLACLDQLLNQIVLVNCSSGKVASRIDECRECSSGQSLQSQQCGSRRVGDKRSEESVLWLFQTSLVKYRERIVKVLLLLARLISIEWHREVVSQRVDYDDYSLVEALRVPTAVLNIARRKATLELDRRDGAFGAVLEDEAGQEEAGAEEVDSKRVEDAGQSVSLGRD